MAAIADPAAEPCELGPVEMVVLQGTSLCNLNCSYCYLSEAGRKAGARMELCQIELTARRIFSSPFLGRRLRISWHSGEPMTLGVDYYREAIATILAQRDEILGPAFPVDFDIQTNGTLIDEQWCKFILEMNGMLLVGVSCDGPAELHDQYRRNWSGRPSHEKTEAGMRLLASHGIDFDITAVLSQQSLSEPEKFLDYFSQFTPHIREFHYNLLDELFFADSSDPAVDAYVALYRNFLERLLTHLERAPRGSLPPLRNLSGFYNRLFVPPEDRPAYDARAMSKPFKTLSIETNGDVTTFYAGLTIDECRDLVDIYGDGKGFAIGNIYEMDLAQIAAGEKLAHIRRDFETSHAACEARCEYYDLCSGGYNLIKYRRFSAFDVTETPECRVHVKTFADNMLSHMNNEKGVVA